MHSVACKYFDYEKVSLLIRGEIMPAKSQTQHHMAFLSLGFVFQVAFSTSYFNCWCLLFSPSVCLVNCFFHELKCKMITCHCTGCSKPLDLTDFFHSCMFCRVMTETWRSVSLCMRVFEGDRGSHTPFGKCFCTPVKK